MTAGGISYSGIVGARKVTLPSVESWGTNMNILRDPPKSIFTRKIDKVFDTQEYSRMVEASADDRYCENIQVYPRGINPSVSISYGNYGNNGGKLMHFGKGNQLSGGDDYKNGQSAIYDSQNPANNRPGFGEAASSWQACQVSNGNTMAKYPYRVDIDGDFRPPIWPEARLAPLSRLPRNVTNLYTNPLTPKWIDRSTCDESVYKRAIKTEFFNTNVTPTCTYQMGAIQSANNRTLTTTHLNNVIRDNINTETFTQKSQNIHPGPKGLYRLTVYVIMLI